MFVSLCVSDDRPFILSLGAAIKKQYPTLPYALHEISGQGLQLRLEGYASYQTDVSTGFVRGFTAAWEIMEKKSDAPSYDTI